MQTIEEMINAARAKVGKISSLLERQRERLEHEEKGSDDYKLLHREVVSLVEQETALEQQVVKLLAQKTSAESDSIISTAALARLKRSTFVIRANRDSSNVDTDTTHQKENGSDSNGSDSNGSDSNGSGYSSVGVGMFVTESKAVTAAHNLSPDQREGSPVSVVLPEEEEELLLKVLVRDDDLDVAVLKYAGQHEHLDVYKGPISTLVGQRLCLCTFILGIEEELDEFSRSVAVLAAYVNKESKHGNHFVYQCSTWPGDSGAALVMRNGELVGVHVAGVNSLKEKVEKKHSVEERLTVVEESMEDVARSTASGCIAVTTKTFVTYLD